MVFIPATFWTLAVPAGSPVPCPVHSQTSINMCERKDKLAEGHRPYPWVNSSELSVPSPKVHEVSGSVPSYQEGPALRPGRRGHRSALLTWPAGKTALGPATPDHALPRFYADPAQESVERTSLTGCCGVPVPPSSVPSVQQECRHVSLWGHSFVPLATSPSLYPQPDIGEITAMASSSVASTVHPLPRAN